MDSYKGAIVLESLEDLEVIKDFKVLKVEETATLHWHIYDVEATRGQLEKLSKVIKPTKWYAHFWNEKREVIVVFRDRIFEINHEDKKSWETAIEYGLSVDIPREQLDFLIP